MHGNNIEKINIVRSRAYYCESATGGGPVCSEVRTPLKCKFDNFPNSLTSYLGLVSLRGSGRDDISIQFAYQDFRPSWIYRMSGCQALLYRTS